MLRRRRRLLAVLAAAVLLSVLAVVLTSTDHSASTTTTSTSSTSTTVAVTTSTVTTTTSPDNLAPTSTKPATTETWLQLRLQPIWTAITTNAPNAGFSVFFPESVYVRMKSGIIGYPASDWNRRLWAFYRLDVAAYHQLVAAGPVTFLSVKANTADVAWIGPGACENHFGYWHLPNVRIVYSVKGVVRSFAVASLISWRGQWYVVHLGPNPRPVDVGTVALPSAGPGVPGPGGGC